MGVTQAQLAEAVGAHRVTISDWERSPRPEISSSMVIALCDYLEIEPTWLLTGQGAMRPSPTSGKSFEEVIRERMGAIRGALGHLVVAGHESQDFMALGVSASAITEFAHILFHLDNELSSDNRALNAPLVNAVLAARNLAGTDREFSRYLEKSFCEIAELLDATQTLWQEYENGDLELTPAPESPTGHIFMDRVLALTAPDKYQVVSRWSPRASEDDTRIT